MRHVRDEELRAQAREQTLKAAAYYGRILDEHGANIIALEAYGVFFVVAQAHLREVLKPMLEAVGVKTIEVAP
jgi:hypothetical protein